MPFRTIEQSDGLTTVVNTEQVTYLRQDAYGTAIHLTSGEHVICRMEIDDVLQLLTGGSRAEVELIRR